jgi:hypothetical protein
MNRAERIRELQEVIKQRKLDDIEQWDNPNSEYKIVEEQDYIYIEYIPESERYLLQDTPED